MQDVILQNTNRKNLLQLLWLRLFAILGQIITILLTEFLLKISLPLGKMFFLVFLQIIFGLYGFFCYKKNQNISDKFLFLHLLFDVIALSFQLYFSGGASNPFISLFLLQVIISIILLKRIYAYLIAILTIISYIILGFFYWHVHEFHHDMSGNFFSLHLLGMLLSYVIAAILLLVFIGKIIKNLEEKNSNILSLQNEISKKEYLARLGLIASSAAHELSTPLTTISLILDEWKNSKFSSDLTKDLKIAQTQIDRCKNIISEILENSEKSRLQEANLANAKEFFDNLINQWKLLRNFNKLIYNFEGKSDKKIIVNEILNKAFFNILDNALEASPNYVEVVIESSKDKLKIFIKDQGIGFKKEILENLGKPNITTKNSSGMGLFLAINSLEKFGANLSAKNLESGALVTVSFYE